MFIRSIRIVVLCWVAVLIFVGVESHVHREVTWLNSRPNLIPIGQAPWLAQIKLKEDETFVCSGAIVSARHVVSAARCFDDYQKDQLIVVVAEEHVARIPSTVYNTKSPKTRNVEALYRHPEYQKGGSGNADVAVLKVDANFNTGRYTKAIPLCKSPLTPTDYVIVAGWGHNDVASMEHSNELRRVALTLMPVEECRDFYRNKNREIADTMFCAGPYQRNSDCDGDVGSPVIRNMELCGIASRGIGCGSNSDPSIITSVTAVQGFINDCMNDRCIEE